MANGLCHTSPTPENCPEVAFTLASMDSCFSQRTYSSVSLVLSPTTPWLALSLTTVVLPHSGWARPRGPASWFAPRWARTCPSAWAPTPIANSLADSGAAGQGEPHRAGQPLDACCQRENAPSPRWVPPISPKSSPPARQPQPPRSRRSTSRIDTRCRRQRHQVTAAHPTRSPQRRG